MRPQDGVFCYSALIAGRINTLAMEFYVYMASDGRVSYRSVWKLWKQTALVQVFAVSTHTQIWWKHNAAWLLAELCSFSCSSLKIVSHYLPFTAFSTTVGLIWSNEYCTQSLWVLDAFIKRVMDIFAAWQDLLWPRRTIWQLQYVKSPYWVSGNPPF